MKCQQEKSQTKNRTMAMRMLRAKLYEMEQERITTERDSLRRGQVGTGDRSEKIRTYNFPQDRLTDHRIGVTWHNLPARHGRATSRTSSSPAAPTSRRSSSRPSRRGPRPEA